MGGIHWYVGPTHALFILPSLSSLRRGASVGGGPVATAAEGGRAREGRIGGWRGAEGGDDWKLGASSPPCIQALTPAGSREGTSARDTTHPPGPRPLRSRPRRHRHRHHRRSSPPSQPQSQPVRSPAAISAASSDLLLTLLLVHDALSSSSRPRCPFTTLQNTKRIVCTHTKKKSNKHKCLSTDPSHHDGRAACSGGLSRHHREGLDPLARLLRSPRRASWHGKRREEAMVKSWRLRRRPSALGCAAAVPLRCRRSRPLVLPLGDPALACPPSRVSPPPLAPIPRSRLAEGERERE